MSKRRKTSQTGFTLIEILIVVAIIGIGSAIAVPSYIEWNARYVLRQAISDLASNLTMARISARNRNIAVVSTLTLVGTTVTMNTTNVAGTVVVIPPVTFPPAIIDVRDAATPLGAPAPPPVTIAFTPLGIQGAGTSPLPVLITNNGGLTYSVFVTPSGKVNWCVKVTCP
jgi:type IV fimbrial biogenesis protein FimT